MSHRVEAWLRVPLVLVEGRWEVDRDRVLVPQEAALCREHGRDCEAVWELPPLPGAVALGKTYARGVSTPYRHRY